ncbi:MAG TPA: molybdopterin-dependent oxidoreductase, partial [Candidatus Cloacimonas sp.]|nr:molybdopterin-dependent oxidoreductase [Candidatus Cloacimonas sp.]
ANDVIIEVPRLGGAFGGKERGATIWACMAALGAFLTKRPVLVKLTRAEDMHYTGKRHPFTSLWRVGYDENGKILAYDLLLLANGGAYADLSMAILERAIFHSENAYFIPDIRIRGYACKTNLPPNTAFRGFGAPQGIFVIESILDKIARQLKIDSLEIRQRNAYQNGQLTPYGQEITHSQLNNIYAKLAEKTNYSMLKEEVAEFNKHNPRYKRGIGITPVKFGISFTTALLNQGSALVWVYIDGSVSVSTGGVEMGQELSTKVAIVVSRVLGISVNQIRVESSNTQRIGNASPTAASTGSDINGNAARLAAEKIKANLTQSAIAFIAQKYELIVIPEDIVFSENKVFGNDFPDAYITFPELVSYAYSERVPLAAYGYYKTPGLWFDRDKGIGHPFHYFVYGAALAEVELDTLLGEHTIRKLFIVHENGNSLNEVIDRGQIEGAVLQGIGWCTMEDLIYDEKGFYLSANPSTYKIPGIRNLPAETYIEIIPSATEEASVFGSKGIGEPPLIYGLSVFFALQAAGKEANPEKELSFPATPESLIK